MPLKKKKRILPEFLSQKQGCILLYIMYCDHETSLQKLLTETVPFMDIWFKYVLREQLVYCDIESSITAFSMITTMILMMCSYNAF